MYAQNGNPEAALRKASEALELAPQHHFALMATMLRVSGDNVEQDFGVAPSTLVHEHAVKASA